VFTSAIKDEPVSEAKVKIGKLRVFLMSPVDATIVMRKYLLGYCRVSQRNPFVFENAVGMNCHSEMWTHVHTYLTRKGNQDRIVAGDYKHFDKSLQALLLDQVKRVIVTICAQSGNYDPEELRATAAVLEDVINPTLDYFGTILEAFGTNPSGNAMTVHINGIANSLLLRYAYAIIGLEHGFTVHDYRQHCHLLVYGDDNIIGVSEDRTMYNQQTIASALGAVGVIYTDAEKRESFPEYVTMSDATFLKRRWAYDGEIQGYRAPLDKSSFGKMLLLSRNSDHVHRNKSELSTLGSYMTEAWHHGPQYYQGSVDQVQELLSLESFSGFDPPQLLTYRQRCDAWATSSKGLHHYTNADFDATIWHRSGADGDNSEELIVGCAE
jgi:hypothetical protein